MAKGNARDKGQMEKNRFCNKMTKNMSRLYSLDRIVTIWLCLQMDGFVVSVKRLFKHNEGITIWATVTEGQRST